MRDDPRPLYVTAQGALTDVAATLNRCPAIAEKLTVVWIGGFPYPEGGGEFNLMQDVTAGGIALRQIVKKRQAKIGRNAEVFPPPGEALDFARRPCYSDLRGG